MRYPATLICLAFIFYLFWKDLKQRDAPSFALWVPLAWMFLAGSRYLSSWLGLSQQPNPLVAYSEGSLVDAAAFLFLILAGVFILWTRRLDWGQLLRRNVWIWLYFAYCAMSIFWSDDSLLTLKRYIKELGNPVMALVILTEERPYEAAGVLLKRLAFLLLPLSLLFIRYFPDMGRAYHIGGEPMYTGVGHQKNDLGAMCLMAGIYFAWQYILKRKKGSRFLSANNIPDFILMGSVVYLLRVANSATSLACLAMSVGLCVLGRTRLVSQRPGRLIGLTIGAALLFFLLDMATDVSGVIIRALGRDETLTGRGSVWSIVSVFAKNPIVGTGFMNFWSGERLQAIWAAGFQGINQAHNGYLEQYLNLGYVGLAFIAVIMLGGLVRVHKHLNADFTSAVLRFVLIVTALLYNYTEASFYGINDIWLLTLLALIEVPYGERAGKTGRTELGFAAPDPTNITGR